MIVKKEENSGRRMIMKRRIKTTFCLLAAAICFLFPLKGQAADSYEWVMDSVNARIQYVNTTTGEPLKSQFKKIKGYIYYFDKNGYAATGFTKIDGFYYYFDSTGAMLRSEWRADRYFLYNGRMAVNQYVKSATGYTYVGKDGTPVENYSKSRPARFIKDSVGFRYRNLDGTYSRKTWQCIKGSWYYFYSSGYMARRTKLDMYYVGTNGKMVTNRWIKIGNYKYYYGADGRMTKKVRIKSSSTGSSGNTIVDIN